MSHAPSASTEDPTTPRNTAYREANARHQELLRNGVSNSGHERNCCHLNIGSGRFANISAAAGLDHIGDGRAYAIVDWDQDGDLDLWTTNRTGPRVQLLRNNIGRDQGFVSLQLQGNGNTTNRDAIGARVALELHGDDRPLVKTLRAGEGFLSQSTKRLHFGLGRHDQIDRVTVRWPGGEPEEFTGIEAGRAYRLVQGSGVTVRQPPRGETPELSASPNRIVATDDLAQIQLRYPMPLPQLSYETLAGQRRSITAERADCVLVNLWASWCQPCLEELSSWKKSEDDLRDAGIQVIALSVDKLAKQGTAQTDSARGIIERQSFPFEAGFVTAESIAKLEAVFYYLFSFRRPWAVPTSVLLNHEGHLAFIYIGPVDAAQIISDASRRSLDDQAWLASALPFPGRWSRDARHPNLAEYISTLFDHGFREDALGFLTQYESVLRGDAEFGMMLRTLASRLVADQQREQARLVYEMLVRLAPDDVAARMKLGGAAAGEQRWDEASAHFRAVTEIEPELVEGHYQLGRVLQRSGALEEALTAYEHAVQLESSRVEIHYSFATALIAANQIDAALQRLRLAYQIDDQSVQVLNGLAWLLATRTEGKGERTALAVQLAERAAALTNHAHPQVLDTLAAAYAADGDFAQAISTAEAAIVRSDNPEHQEALRQRLEAYRRGDPYRE